LVSLPEKRITISPDSTADLRMCGFYEEVAAQVMSTCADALTTNDSIVVLLNEFTKKSLEQVHGIADIKNPATAQWMQRFAVAEGLNSAA
jgi:hypothetical protein